uniref:MHC class I-like antigen recognition-like domain-containing protein n=1 Tax=Poecilia formosa TaxID=48698 RepID=A0A096LQZ6_POEFO
MKWLVILLMFSQGSSAETHVLKVYFTGSSGLTSFLPFEAVGRLDDIDTSHCNNEAIDAKIGWVKKLLSDNPKIFELLKRFCFIDNPAFFKYIIAELMKNFNQTEGIHTFQMVGGCQLNIETKELKGFLKYGYDGEDFVEFDLKGLKWIALKKEAVFLKQLWDMDTRDLEFHHYALTDLCYEILNTTLVYGQSSLFKTGTVLHRYLLTDLCYGLFNTSLVSGQSSLFKTDTVLQLTECTSIQSAET